MFQLIDCSLPVFAAIDVAVSVSRHETGSIIVPGNNIQLVYVLTLNNTNEPDWNSDVAAVEPNPTGGDNFQVMPLLGDEDMAAGDDMVFILTGNFDLTDGSLSDGVNGSAPLNLTYTATVSLVITSPSPPPLVLELPRLRVGIPICSLRIQIMRSGCV